MLKFSKIFFNIWIFTLNVLSGQDKQFTNNFQQSDYRVNFERIELASYNKDYCQNPKIVTFKYNRTSPLVNMTVPLKIGLDNEVQAIIQAYRFASNEYRLFPLRFQLNGCEALSKNIFGVGALMKCGNFTGYPVLKGKVYHICNFAPDGSRFPPLIPNGKYRADLHILHSSTEVLVVSIFLEITRPIARK